MDEKDLELARVNSKLKLKEHELSELKKEMIKLRKENKKLTESLPKKSKIEEIDSELYLS